MTSILYQVGRPQESRSEVRIDSEGRVNLRWHVEAPSLLRVAGIPPSLCFSIYPNYFFFPLNSLSQHSILPLRGLLFHTFLSIFISLVESHLFYGLCCFHLEYCSILVVLLTLLRVRSFKVEIFSLMKPVLLSLFFIEKTSQEV